MYLCTVFAFILELTHKWMNEMPIDLSNKYNTPITDLMWFQEVHNRHYHQDIYHLQLMPKLSHFYKHIIKYRERINECMVMGDDYDNYIIDGLICSISALCALNHNPMANYSVDYKDATFKDLYTAATMPRWDDLGRALTNIGKTLEGFDHIENIDYRKVLVKNFTDVLLTFWGLRKSNIGCFIDVYVSRLTNLKRNNIFHDYLVEEIPKFTKDGELLK